ncbi:head-tail connector protein [Candidatus Hepatobacter penaei]|uniref:head-tail connector protein n=1 Tax=Candidatus Hepatobacter penaei TaxID=1274402 RepID=UPI0004F3C1CD|nr:phage head-tail connector protein [Candidatus Hepatobacter penaei]
MTSKLIAASSTLAVSLVDMKDYAHITHDHDNHLLEGLIRTATAWVEEATGKTLLEKTWRYTHTNPVLTLPHGPITDILEVKSGNRVLLDSAYEVEDLQNTKKITVLSAEKNRRKTSVTYKAGFGTQPEELPDTFRQAVMSTVLYIYEDRYDLSAPKKAQRYGQPWIEYHRSYQMV